jgi:urocanate hydratase
LKTTFDFVFYYLSRLCGVDEQTLVLYSGHPMGLFPSSPSAPRAVITNGMMIPNYSSRTDYDRSVVFLITTEAAESR